MIKQLPRLLFFIAYPVLIHLSTLQSEPAFIGLALISLAVAILYSGLLNSRFPQLLLSWLVLLVISAIVLLLNSLQLARYFVYLLPIVIPWLVSIVFFESLLPGRLPLVADIGEQARGELGEGLYRYATKVTWFWAAVLLLLGLEALLLLLFTPIEVWSVVTSFINYVVIGLIFFAEFALRRRLFPEHDHPTFIEYLKILFTHKPRRNHVR